jgi:hypothetical protein
MDPATLFSWANDAVLPFWALLVLAPHWTWTQRLVHSSLVPAALGVVYASIVLTSTPPGPEATGGAELGSLAWVMAMFTSPMAVVAGWIHYLAFDLFVGAWEVRDAQRLGIRHWYAAPCVLLTFMLGPLGLLCYLALRLALRRTTSLDEAPV